MTKSPPFQFPGPIYTLDTPDSIPNSTPPLPQLTIWGPTIPWHDFLHWNNDDSQVSMTHCHVQQFMFSLLLPPSLPGPVLN